VVAIFLLQCSITYMRAPASAVKGKCCSAQF